MGSEMQTIDPKKAPLWELSLSASTASPQVYSPYWIREIHRAVEADYPRIDRQPAFTGYGVHPTPNNALHQQHAEFIIGPGMPQRWHFLTEDNHRLVQLQENFLAANWRRMDKGPGEIEYPGFDAQLAEFERWVNVLETIDTDRPPESPFPNPDRCEISYDNLIPLIDGDGKPLRFREVLAPFSGDPRPPQKVLGWQASWFRFLPDQREDVAPEMQVLLSGGISISSMNGSFLRIQIICRSPVETWPECSAFFRRAHAHCAAELFNLTTEAVHSTWRE